MVYRNYYLTINNKLFNALESVVEKHNKHLDKTDKNRISMDKAVFLIHYIDYKKSQVRENSQSSFVRISSQTLNLFLKKELKKYKAFLVKHEFIKTIPYCKINNLAIGYKVLYIRATQKEAKDTYDVYEFLNKEYETFLFKEIDKIESKKKRAADRNTKHLTKWLNGNEIQIDWKKALHFINNGSFSDDKKSQYSSNVNRIRFKQWHYTRTKNDNRLHSNLTNLKEELRAFITHKEETLVSLDIKSSQPYLLAGILNLLKNKSISKLDFILGGIRSRDVRSKFHSLMNSISYKPIDITGLELYINLICQTDIYAFVNNNLSVDFKEKIKDESNNDFYIKKTYCTKRSKQIIKSIKKRKFCKSLTLEYMYCSLENYSGGIKEIKRIYPAPVNKFIYDFKYCKEIETPRKKRKLSDKRKIEKAKKLFPKFLQQIESFIILDVITNELSKQYPKMFMATIHDSVIVTKKHESEVKNYLKNRLLEIFDIPPKIKSEDWTSSLLFYIVMFFNKSISFLLTKINLDFTILFPSMKTLKAPSLFTSLLFFSLIIYNSKASLL
ncbi:hypothetical protein [uncultured Tenacibaculum sp.]|uniref:hypothetical protein n=1 Tax=uncultured Tenacibaculum sp. TaxID=174713 RepID=UPI00262F3140|nr:hypothetical protein [uncultured Tenacibaculum sp.]